MIRLSSNASFEWCEIGKGLPVLIIDGALDDPERVRQEAWRTRFHLPGPQEYYPGWQSAAQMSGEKEFIAQIGTRFLDRLWPQGWPAPLTVSDLKPHSTFSVFGLNRKLAAENGYIDQHVDSFSWIAVVSYLFDNSLQPGQERGTAFWKHKPTDLDSFFLGDLLQAAQIERLFGLRFIDPFRRAAGRIAATSMSEAQNLILESRGGRRRLFSLEEDDTWGLLKFVEARFNRVVAYPTWQFHSIVDTTEHKILSTRNARLTYNTFVPYPVPATMGPQSKYRGGGYFPVEDMLVG
jgi:hypothetical protein